LRARPLEVSFRAFDLALTFANQSDEVLEEQSSALEQEILVALACIPQTRRM